MHKECRVTYIVQKRERVCVCAPSTLKLTFRFIFIFFATHPFISHFKLYHPGLIHISMGRCHSI